MKRNQMRAAALPFALAAFWAILLTFASHGLLAQAPAPSSEAVAAPSGRQTASPPASPAADVVSVDDELEVDVLDVPEVSRVYRVSAAGTIMLPLLANSVPAAGLTTAQLAESIHDRLHETGMVTDAQVSVQIKSSRLHSIAILGAVKKPQIYPLFGKTTLLDALSQAEGLADDAGSTAVITRGDAARDHTGSSANTTQAANAAQTVVVNLDELLENGDAALNVDLYPGDRVTVQRAGIVYVVGAVNRAGGFVLKDDHESMTVLKAIALAENLKSTAVPKKTVIIRKQPGSQATTEIALDLTKILSGHASDQPLAANDILFVPDSSGKKALHRAGEAAAQAASLFVYRLP
jgi:polysaccharide biosynthesis/export protein